MSTLEDKVNVGSLWLIAVIGSVVTLAIIVGLKYMYYDMQRDLESEIGTANNRLELIELREAQEQELNSYGFVDQTAGTVRLPIDMAMERVVANGGKN